MPSSRSALIPTGATFNRRGWHALSHLPDAGGGPFWADLQILNRPLEFTRRVQAQCGPVARTVIGGQPHVLLLSAQALETVLLDRERVFSSRGGWSSLLGELFPRGLLLRDGDEHRHHRRLLLPAMRREALADYLQRMVAPVQQAVQGWIAQGALPQLGLGAMRRLALSRAADLLLALDDPAEVEQAEHDFAELVEASTALVRMPLIGRRYARGLKARARLVDSLSHLTRRRRQSPGPDLLSRLIEAHDETGQRLEDDEIVDHLVFLMMAAHDTTASALSSALALLAQHPQWQRRLRDEQPQMTRFIREVLRLNPPVALLQRQTLRDTEVDGHRLPAGALISLLPLHVQRDPQWWADPDRFDPDRFDPAHLAPGRMDPDGSHPRPPHPYAWAPFGGGPHLCLGQHLAETQMRLVLTEVLRHASLHLPPGQSPRWRHAPITHSADRLPILLRAPI